MTRTARRDQSERSAAQYARDLRVRVEVWGQTPSPVRDLGIAAGFGAALGAAVLISPLAALALIVGLVVAAVIVPRPLWMLYILLAAIPLTSGMPRGTLLPFLKPNEAILMVTLGVVFLAYCVTPVKRAMPGPVLFTSLVLVMGTVVAPVVSFYARGWSLSMSDLLSFLAPVQYLILFFVFANIPETAAQRERMLQIMFLMASVVALLGLLQGIQVPWVVSLLQTWYPSGHVQEAAQVGRITSVLGAWNVLGTFMMLNLLLITALQDRAQPSRLYRYNTRVSAVLSLFCLLAAGSFASIFGVLFGYVGIKLFEPRGMKALVPFLLVGSLAALALAPLLSTRLAFQFANNDGSILPHTLVDRFDIWTGVYLPLIAENPIWGVRPNTQGLSWPFAESEYINQLFHGGVISLGAHFIWLGGLLVWLRQVIQAGRSTARKLAILLFVMLITLSIMGLTNAVFTYSGIIDYLWILLGLTAMSVWQEETSPEPA